MADPQVSSDEYERREVAASPEIRETIKALQKEATDKNWTFEVGYTTAMNYTFEQLCGMRPPENWLAEATEQNKLVKAQNIQTTVGLGSCVASAASFNWADHNGVTGVRNQLNCGSCWDFGTHGAFEGNYAILNGTLIDSSEQNTLDCSGAGSCAGGWWAFQYLINKGSATEVDYPYTAVQGTCRTNVSQPYKAVAWGYVDSTVDIPSVDALKKALCDHGPLGIAVAVTPAFQAYKSGVFNENSNANINHAITLVGWDDSKKAWRIKNSWGTGWGEAGFMWIAYGCNKIGYGAAWVQAQQGLICKEGPSLMAYQEFNWPDKKQVSANANVASVTFTLTREMYVTMVVDSSAIVVQGTPPKSFTTGIYTGADPNTMWTASLRKGTFVAANQSIPVHSSFAVKMAAGTYTVYWKMWLSGYTVQFDSGTLTILAVPCSMGGQLQTVQEAVGREMSEVEGMIVTRDVGSSDVSVTHSQS